MHPVPVTHGNKIAMFLLCSVFLSAPFVQAQCIDTSASPTTSASVSFSGSDYSFNSPVNALVNDVNRTVAASVLQLFSDKQTDYLQVKGFGFNIPTAASICGIGVHVVKSADNVLLSLAYVKDYNVRVMKNGSPVGANLADVSTEWPAAEATTTYGGNGELWGTTWFPSDINNSNFGFSISGNIHGTAALFPSARINYISMTVYYLDPTVLREQALQFQVANGANHSAALSWKSNAADQAASFSIERSPNGMKWQPVQGAPPQHSNSSMFTFIDAQPLPGKSFYRLKMTANSRDVHYSTVQPYQFVDIPSFKCYPNPATTILQIAGVIPGERVLLADLYGKWVFQSPLAVNNTIKIDVAHLQPGMYVITVGNRKMKIRKNKY